MEGPASGFEDGCWWRSCPGTPILRRHVPSGEQRFSLLCFYKTSVTLVFIGNLVRGGEALSSGYGESEERRVLVRFWVSA